MAKLITRASVAGATLSGPNTKGAFTGIWDALNSAGLSDQPRSTITTSATLATTQCGLLLVDATSGSVVLTLPTSGSATDDAIYTIRRIDNGANSVTVQRGGTDTIEGGTATVLIPPGGSTELQLPGGSTNWRICMASGGTAQGARNNISANDSLFRNRAINGNMFEDQRNSGAAQTIVAAAALAYCVDRFYAYCTGANVTGQQITAADGTKRYRFTGAASVTGIGFGHRFEAANTVDLAGNTCTFSIKLANSLLTTVTWNAYYANTADTFGTLASPSRTLIASGTFTVNSTEALYSAQIAVPAAATTGIEIVCSVGAQISGTWSIGEFSLEKGAIPAAAISFERVDVGINNTRCRRYARPFPALVAGQAYGTAVAFYGFDTGTPMRATPTASGGVYTTSNSGGVGVSGTLAVTSMVGSVIRFDMSAVTGAPLVAGNVTMLVPPAGTPMLTAEL